MEEDDVNLWKTKKLLTMLREATGAGTSVVSIILRPGESIHKMSQKLVEEQGTATNIKTNVNKKSVLSAISSAQHRLKMYSKCPPNGLVIYSGEVIGSDGKERKLVLDFEPFKPINTTMYLCDNRFHIEPLENILLDEKKYAFIIVDGNGYMLATVSGNTRQILDKMEVELPSKTRRGGQSSNRYARLRDIAKHEYVKKVCERLKSNLILDDKIAVEGIIVAGNADVKNDLLSCALLDARIRGKVISTLDISYGGQTGFEHAINLSKEKLGNMKYIAEKTLLDSYFENIARDTGMFSFSPIDTISALEAGAVDTLIVWEDLKLEKWKLSRAGEEIVRYVNPDTTGLGADEKLIEKIPLIDYLVENHKGFGATLKFVSDNTSEGSQFVKGFGGLGAILRYKMDFADYDGEEFEDEEDDDNMVDQDGT